MLLIGLEVYEFNHEHLYVLNFVSVVDIGCFNLRSNDGLYLCCDD